MSALAGRVASHIFTVSIHYTEGASHGEWRRTAQTTTETEAGRAEAGGTEENVRQVYVKTLIADCHDANGSTTA